MLDVPQITNTEAQRTARIHLTIPRAEIQNVMGPGIQEVLAALADQGIEPTGPWLTHHLTISPDVFDFDICVPVTVEVLPVGRVTAGMLPAAQVARTIYRGGYEGLGATWGELGSWIVASGYTAAPDLWECYVVGPESSSHPADWQTQLNRPLVS